jgi:hypothetical protein
MNLEASAKEHIKSLQRHLEAKITADMRGRVSVNLFSPSLIMPTHNKVTVLYRGPLR